MNNLDRIKDMNADEITEILANDNKCEFCIYEDDICQTSQCRNGINKWLKFDMDSIIQTIANELESNCMYTQPYCEPIDCDICKIQYIVNHFNINNGKVTKIDK